DRARRSAAQDREWVLHRPAEDVTNGLEDADLVSSARTAAGEHKCRPRVRAVQNRLCSWPRGAPASTTASAVMFTIRRTVAEGVTMCTARAAPSRIGPIVTPSAEVVFSRLNAMFAASS